MKILVIEDEQRIAHLIKEGLTDESYAVDVCYDGETGLSWARSTRYDLIVLDRMLPNNIDGLAACRQLREEGDHTPIILLTAKDQVNDRIEGLNSGADDYLTKPFDFFELLARIHALLRRPPEVLGGILSAGDLTLSTVAKEVRRQGEVIPVRPKEFAILEFLLRNQDRVMSKEHILNNVWDFDSDTLPSSIEVYITHLRQKIDAPFSGPPLISTVRGFGYKINSRS